jgi:hypothetical protein
VRWLLVALLLSGCAYISGPCYLVVQIEEKYAVCEVGGNMVVMPAKLLEIGKEKVIVRP